MLYRRALRFITQKHVAGNWKNTMLIDRAYEALQGYPEQLLCYCPVKTICLHGSPKQMLLRITQSHSLSHFSVTSLSQKRCMA
mgnify:CR=1 FL=1